MSNKIVYNELVVFHPGYYVKEMIDEAGMSQEELAMRLQTSGKNVSDLVHGRINLADDMALRLSIVFGTTVSLWLSLEKNYVEKKLEIERRKRETVEEKYMKMLDYSYWKSLGVVPEAKTIQEQVRELQQYFRVVSLDVLAKRNFMVQYRTNVAEVQDVNVVCANAWVQTALNFAEKKVVQEYNRSKLLSKMKEIRRLTQLKREKALPELEKILAECGVVLVLLPELENCGVTGAVKWVGKEKAVLALNSSNKDETDFWFSLFHEIGHVLQKRLKVLMVNEKAELLENHVKLQELEEKANEFGNEMLVPRDRLYQLILDKDTISEDIIKKIALDFEVPEGIILRRMQQEERLLAYFESIYKYKTP